jgi:steroid delta-isomerase-like uncharacterized protein
MSDAHKAVIRRHVEEAWNSGELLVTHDTFHTDYTGHHRGEPQTHALEGHKDTISAFRSAFPDMHLDVDMIIAEGDMAAARLIFTGTQAGAFMNIPATGKPVKVSALVMFRMKHGKIHESWAEWDRMNLMQQLGVMPTAPAPKSG